MWYRHLRSQRARFVLRDHAARRVRKARRHLPEPVFLEDRTLLSFTLPQVTAVYDSAAAAIGTAANAGAIVDQVLGVNSLPLANQTLTQALGVAADFLTPFETALAQNTTDWNNTVEPQLISAGFSIPVPFTGSLGGVNNGLGFNNLLEVTWSRTLNTNDPIQILGQTGFSYLDGAGGGLFGGITASGSVTVTLTMGVDYNSTSQQLGFFVAPGGNVVQASLTSSTSNALSGSLAIGDLANVSATATAGVSFSGALGLEPTTADTDGKLRLADLTTNLSSDKAVTGPGVNGSATINVSQFDAQLFGLPDITWSGVISTSVQNNIVEPESDNLQEPSPSSLLNSLGSSLFSLGDGIPVLGSLSNTLDQPLPLIGESIAQLTGLDKYLPSLPSLPSGFSSFNGTYDNVAGGTLTVDVTPTTIDQFLHGQDVSLVSWQTSNDVDLLDKDITIPIWSLGVPDIASLELDATFGIQASLDYNIGFGLDGHGFYALAGTPSDPTLGLSFGVTAGVQGQVEVFGLPLAEAGGDIGFSVTPYVALTPAPASVDPDSDPSKVYMSDLALFGKDPLTDILDDLSAGIEGDFTGDLYASIDLLFFSLSWNWGISIPVFNYERAPTWPAPSGSGPGVTPWPNATQHGGVVTFSGTAAADNVTLTPTPGVTNGLTVGWSNAPSGYQTSEEFTGVTSFVFDGGSGNDTLTASPGLATSVRAVGGSGNDTFDLRNSSASNTLVAGTGQNNLFGGSGADLIIGGKGSDTLTAGSGTDTLYGGSGNATVDLGAGHDAFYGGKGNYNIQGGAGTYTIDGGTGSDVINAGTGSHNTIYGGAGGKNTITGSSGGFDTIYGGGAGDTIFGGGGHDTIYGSGGSLPGAVTGNVITGGPLGFNLIFGGGGGDVLAGGVGGNNTIYAGAGNETLAGGDGLGLVVNPLGNGLIDAAGDGDSIGNNTLIGGSGNDTLFGDSSGHNLLQGGTGNDTMYAGSGGDTLVASLGNDALYGSIGNDTFQLPFTPAGQSQPDDTLVGGGGADTLALKAESGNGTAGLDVTADAVPDATTTSLTVSNGLAVAADLPSSGSGLVIQIGSEQMLVTAVNGNILTVQRGFGGTTPAPHGGNALVLLPNNVSSLASPDDYELYLNQSGAANQYTATLSTLRFATTGAGSTTVTGIDNTAGLAVGQAVTGSGVPAGTTIAAMPSSNSITLSNPATLSQSDLPLTFGTVGGIALTLPGDIPNIQLEAGPGNNFIQVDPSVTRDVTIYGGPGFNVLMAGSGNDSLIAGPGPAVLYGGSGQDTLYGGDLPTQDVPPTAADPSRTVVTSNTGAGDGNDTLIAGPGNDELFAGSGNDLLIGGSVARLVNPVTGTPGVALLQNGQYQLIVGAGRDILAGGAGNDVLIAGPGGPGAVLEAGTGNNTLIAQNYGVNTLSGGSTGHSLLLGGNLENFEISNSAASGGNTLVGGLGIDNLQAGAGSDVLYASFNAAAWSQGEAAAAADGVHIVPPQLFQGDSTASQLQALLVAQQAAPLTQTQQNQLIALLTTEFNALAGEEAALNTQVSNDLAIPNLSENPTLKAQLIAVATQDEFVQTETTALLNQILNALGAAGFQEDRLIGGSGTDTFYGNIQGATQMGGGSGAETFFNYNASDTIQGNLTSVNTLVLQDYQGNNAITLSQDNKNVNAVDFTVNGQTLPVGDTGNVSGIQTLEIQLGSGNDTVSVNLATLPSSGGKLTGLEVLSGTGNDLIDASQFTGQETITGGAGNDVIKVGAIIGNTSQLTGTSTTELDLDVLNGTGANVVNVNKSGLTVNSFSEPLSMLGTFGKLVVAGGAGSNSFTTDGSIPDVVLEGGSGGNTLTATVSGTGTAELIGGAGTNDLTASGGTATLVGGSGSNSFNLNGPGNYTVSGIGSSNALNFNFADNSSNDDILISQTGQLIFGTGKIGGEAISLSATNLSQISVTGGSGSDDQINASNVNVPTTLFGGTGNDDVVDGGNGNDTIYYPVFANGSYSGGGGENELVFVSNAPGLQVSAGFVTYDNYFAISTGSGGFIGPLSLVFQTYGLSDFTTFGIGGISTNGSLIPPTTVFSFVPPTIQALSPGALTFTASGPGASLGLEVTDPNAGATVVASVNWGDGTTSPGTDVGANGTVHTVTASHIFAQYGTYAVTATVTDNQYAPWVQVANNLTGGLRLDGTSLDNYTNASTFTTIDTSVSAYEVCGTDQTLFYLKTNGSLWALPSTGAKQQISGTYESISLGPDGGLYALLPGGNLGLVPAGSVNLQIVDSGVRAIVADTTGDLYKLYASGALSVMPVGSTTWTPVLTNVKSVTPSSGGASVLTNAGVDWQFLGTAGNVVAGPHLVLTLAGTATAGQTLSDTLSVLDAFNNPVLGYTGTVTFRDSDSPAVAAGDGPPLQHTFTAADNGSFSFPLTFLTSGAQTLAVADNGGLTASATLTVNAGVATQFSVNAQPGVVGTPAPIAVTAYDAYGNVATGFTGAVTLTPLNAAAASPITYNFATADQGSHIYNMTFSQPGGQKLVASGGDLAGDGSLVVSPEPYNLAKSTVSVTPTSVLPGGQAAVTLTVRDALGNQESTGGLTVAFALAGGSIGGGNFGPTVDNGDGTYTAVFTAGTVAGTDNITAMIGGVGVTSSPASLAVTAATATASFLKQDAATQGNWINIYGAQGYDIVAGPSSLPSYATVSPSGEEEYTWPTATAPQALEIPNSSSRVAAVWYSATSFTVDVNLTDGQTHNLELYFLDYDNKGRAEKVQISTASGTVLSTESISSFAKGVYLDWMVSGNLMIKITDTAGANAVLNGLFIDPTTSAPATTATFINSDATTQGNWEGEYGAQGYDLVAGPSSLPSYATVSPSGEEEYTWPSATAPQALEIPNSSSRVAAVWYSATSFTVDVNLTDGQTHNLELYFLDYDNKGRAEQVQISTASGTVLSTESISSFAKGVYLDWMVSGNLVIKISDTAGANAVLNGLFIDPTTSAPAATATFINSDATTQGNWEGEYGAQGYDLVAGPSSLPSYATVSPSGEGEYTWPSATAPQALEIPNSSSRVAAVWYSATSFTVDVNLTDGQTHNLELYFLDYDNKGRAEQVQISTASGTVLSTESISSFAKGVYLDWMVSGNLVIKITDTAGANAVLNGLFIDPTSS